LISLEILSIFNSEGEFINDLDRARGRAVNLCHALHLLNSNKVSILIAMWHFFIDSHNSIANVIDGVFKDLKIFAVIASKVLSKVNEGEREIAQNIGIDKVHRLSWAFGANFIDFDQ